MVETVEASGIGPVEVVLHPRSPRDVERGVIPNDWHVSEFVRTLDLLSTTGASVVIQSSSGTGLEALAMGVPVIDLCEPGTAPAYPFIAPPHVMVVSDSSQLRAAADHMDQSESAALARKEYARSWVALVGDDASVAAADAVAHELAERAGPLVLDAWQAIRPSLP
jgi:hypothetical protein